MCKTRHETQQTAQSNRNDLEKWHPRYGYLNLNDLKKLTTKSMVAGLNLNLNVNDIKCEICLKCKTHQLPYKTSTTRASEVLELIHSDICGPIETESLGGGKYFVTFIDDFSRYTEVAILQNRSEVLQAFKDYKRRVEKETGHHIKKLRTDNAREYKSQEFTNLLREEGISRQLSVEYTPQ